jgi:signal transduction histidine kinase
VTATMTGNRNGTVEVRLSNGSVVTFEMVSRTVETPSGTMTVSGASPVEQVARSVDALRRALVVGLPALVLLVAVIAWVLVGRALRPVEAIRAEVDEITGRTMHRRVPEPPTGDEIGRLARTMNAMLARLDAATTRQRQFVSDASHELRSPVATIRTRLEVARRNPDRADWPAVADAALAEESRLESLLDDLLLLAAADENGSSPVKTTPVDLAALAAAEAERPRQVAVQVVHATGAPQPDGDRPDVAVSGPTPPGAAPDPPPATASPEPARATGAPTLPPTVEGDADQLARVVGNLLDNAARHAQSVVRLGVAQDDGVVRVTVDDDGPGIPKEDRERVFERFTRLDGSRTRHSGGAGLGLALVRSIVTRHRGKVWAAASPLGGARFVVEIPAAGH